MGDNLFADDEEFEIEPEMPLFVISVVSQMVNIPAWTLRLLDKEGLVCPKKTRGQTRLYSANDVKKLRKIYFLMEKKGINMKGIKFLIEIEQQNKKTRKKLLREVG